MEQRKREEKRKNDIEKMTNDDIIQIHQILKIEAIQSLIFKIVAVVARYIVAIRVHSPPHPLSLLFSFLHSSLLFFSSHLLLQDIFINPHDGVPQRGWYTGLIPIFFIIIPLLLATQLYPYSFSSLIQTLLSSPLLICASPSPLPHAIRSLLLCFFHIELYSSMRLAMGLGFCGRVKKLPINSRRQSILFLFPLSLTLPLPLPIISFLLFFLFVCLFVCFDIILTP